MKLVEQGERVTMGGKDRGKIRSEAGEVTRIVGDAPTTDSLGKRYRAFCGWGWQLENWRYIAGVF